MQEPHRLAWIDTRAVAQRLARFQVNVQCLRPHPGTVKANHELCPRRFVPGLRNGLRAQPGDDLAMLSHRQPGFDKHVLHGLEFCDQLARDSFHEGTAREVRQLRIAPQPDET
jgi:hypothetical protein